MRQSELEHAMAKAVAAVDGPCHWTITDRNLTQRRPDGWWCIGTVSLVDGSKAYQVYWHPELGRGWLWGIRMLPEGVSPRRFTPAG
jgi:hypothetical protein